MIMATRKARDISGLMRGWTGMWLVMIESGLAKKLVRAGDRWYTSVFEDAENNNDLCGVGVVMCTLNEHGAGAALIMELAY